LIWYEHLEGNGRIDGNLIYPHPDKNRQPKGFEMGGGDVRVMSKAKVRLNLSSEVKWSEVTGGLLQEGTRTLTSVERDW
jgi:hypothetical protein